MCADPVGGFGEARVVVCREGGTEEVEGKPKAGKGQPQGATWWFGGKEIWSPKGSSLRVSVLGGGRAAD